MDLGFREIFVGAAYVLLATLYMLPTVVARIRRHHNTGAIFVLNLLGGWLFVPWLIAIVWAVKKPPLKAA